MFRPGRIPLAVFAVLPPLLVAGCITKDNTPPTPPVRAEVVVRLLPQLDPDLANTDAARRPVSMQFEIHDATTLQLVIQSESDLGMGGVDLDYSVDFTIEVEQASDVDIRGQVWLLGDEGEIEWSGLFDPVLVADDEEVDVWPVEITMGRGNLEDHAVEAVTVQPLAGPLVPGGSEELVADIQGPSSAAVFWGSSNPGVATVDQTGTVTAVGPGETTVSAASGMQVGSTVVTVTDPEG